MPTLRTAAVALLAAASTLSAVPLAAQPSTVQSEVRSRPTGDGRIQTERIVNRTFHRLHFSEPPNPQELLLVLTTEDEQLPEDEGFAYKVNVRAWRWTGAAFGQPAWSWEGAASAARIERWRYVRVTRPGCCAFGDTHTLVDGRDGKVLLHYTDDALFVADTLVDAETIVAFDNGYSYTAPDSLMGLPDFLGVLRLAHTGGAREALVVNGGETDLLRPQLVRCDAQGTPMLGQDIGSPGGFHVCAQTFGGRWLTIPVRGGRFVLDEAKLPPGLTLTPIAWERSLSSEYGSPAP